MADTILADIKSGYNLSAINDNFNKVKAALDGETLKSTGGNNVMDQDLDLNSHRLLNVLDATTNQEPATWKQVQEKVNGVAASLAGAAGVVPMLQPRQTGDGTTTVFASPMTGTTEAVLDSYDITFDGVRQWPTLDFSVSAVDGNITFVEAPAQGVAVDILYYKPKALEPVEADSDSVVTATGATLPRSLGDRFSEVANILDYGAVAGAGDATAAILLAAASGKTVYAPPGVYAVSSPITLTGDLIGAGATFRKTDGNNGANILLCSTSGVVISGIELDGNQAAAGGFTNLQINGGDNIKVLNVTSRNAQGHGISVTNATNVDVVGCVVLDNLSVGIECRSSREVKIADNQVTRCAQGITLSQDVNENSGVSILNNSVSNSTLSGISVPRNTGTSVPYSFDVTCTGNRVVSNGQNGILFQPNRGVLSNNISQANGTLTTHQGLVINGISITIANNVSEGNSGVGIDLGNAVNCTVTGNYISGNGIIGLEINSCSNVVASGNMIRNNYASNPGFTHQAGLVVNGNGGQWPTIPGENIKVTGNTISTGANQTHGIHVQNTTRFTIQGNELVGSGTVEELFVAAASENTFRLGGNSVTSGNLTSAANMVVPADGGHFLITNPATTITELARAGTAVPYKGDSFTLTNTGGSLTINSAGSATIRVVGFGATTLTTNSSITFTARGGVWWETSRSAW